MSVYIRSGKGVRALYRLVDRISVVETDEEGVPQVDVRIIWARLIEIPALKGSDPFTIQPTYYQPPAPTQILYAHPV